VTATGAPRVRITYASTATAPDDPAAAYEAHMRDTHIPDRLVTGCCAAASLSTSASGCYRIRYEAHDRVALDRHLAEHAPRLRTHTLAHFPDGVTLSREEWTALPAWDAPAR
jgi:hypothetical protein